MNNWFKSQFLANPDNSPSRQIKEGMRVITTGEREMFEPEHARHYSLISIAELEHKKKSYPDRYSGVPQWLLMNTDYREGQTYNIRINHKDFGIKKEQYCLEMYSIRGLNPNYIFREIDDAIKFVNHYGGDFEGTSRIIMERCSFTKFRQDDRRYEEQVKIQQKPDPIDWNCARFNTPANLEELYANYKTGGEKYGANAYLVALKLLAGVNANIPTPTRERTDKFLERTRDDDKGVNGFRVGKRKFIQVSYWTSSFQMPPRIEDIKPKEMLGGEISKKSYETDLMMKVRRGAREFVEGKTDFGMSYGRYGRGFAFVSSGLDKEVHFDLPYRISMRPVLVRNQFWRTRDEQLDENLAPDKYGGYFWNWTRWGAHSVKVMLDRPDLHPEDKSTLDSWSRQTGEIIELEHRQAGKIKQIKEKELRERIVEYSKGGEFQSIHQEREAKKLAFKQSMEAIHEETRLEDVQKFEGMRTRRIEQIRTWKRKMGKYTKGGAEDIAEQSRLEALQPHLPEGITTDEMRDMGLGRRIAGGGFKYTFMMRTKKSRGLRPIEAERRRVLKVVKAFNLQSKKKKTQFKTKAHAKTKIPQQLTKKQAEFFKYA